MIGVLWSIVAVTGVLFGLTYYAFLPYDDAYGEHS
jgi:hypothetical protein